MVYTPNHPTWAPGIAGGTLVSAVALNEMDSGIKDASNRLDSVNAQLATLDNDISSLSTQVATLVTTGGGYVDNGDGTITGGTGGSGSGGSGTGGAVSSVAGRTGVVTLTKTDVGLANVDNTSDINKPISAATQAILNSKAPIASPSFTGTVSGVSKAMVGLSSVDNTSDAGKPVSTAQQAALDAKANLNSPTFTGTVSGITKSMVGLSNVDNTSDLTKFTNFGVYPVIHYTGVVWPSRTVPTGYSGPVYWDSATYANIPAPSGAISNDRWERQRIS